MKENRKNSKNTVESKEGGLKSSPFSKAWFVDSTFLSDQLHGSRSGGEKGGNAVAYQDVFYL